jgi:flagellar motility protein MotE (MotC chaperone)
MRRALFIFIIVTIGGGGYLESFVTSSSAAVSQSYSQDIINRNNNSIITTTDIIVLSTSTQKHFPDPFPTPISSDTPTHRHHHHHHKHRTKPPSPFTTRGLAVINRCTLAIQNKNRLKLPKWSDEYLLRPLTVPRLKPSVLTNPHRIGGLYCRAGIWFEMSTETPPPSEEESWLDPFKIRGTRNIESRYALLEFYSIAIGLISIRGLETKEFLCMDRRGELYSTPIENYTTECVFKEEVLENYYNSYTSCAYGNAEKQWFLALKHSGIPRRGRHVAHYDIGAQFLVKELDKDFWIKPQISEIAPKPTNGFDDDGFNWLEKMTNSWQEITKKKKEPQPSLIGIRNIDSDLLEKFYDSISRKFKTRQSDTSKQQQQQQENKKDEKSQSLVINGTEKTQSINELRAQTTRELSSFMERKKRRMNREEKRRRHRRKELEHLRKYPKDNQLRSVARYNHSKALANRLRLLSDELALPFNRTTTTIH